MGALIGQADALRLPLRDAGVDLIVTSPPYFALRSYRDGDVHYDGQLGSEETPGAFVDALIEATAEMVRVLKPTGSIFVNLGDKYAGSGGHNSRDALDRYQHSDGIPAKSLMGLPWRYANAAVDRLGLILRAEIVWNKPNGLPEPVTDRVRRSHEQWFHFVRQGRYFSGLDEVREPQMHPEHSQLGRSPNGNRGVGVDEAIAGNRFVREVRTLHPLGKLPGSVWSIPSEPLRIPESYIDLPDHYAAFPTEWPRRLILGWSPSGICTACGEGRRPAVEKAPPRDLASCACDVPIAPTRPAVVLDPFGGTGTVAAVAHALGRHGVSLDMSRGYCRIAQWRTFLSGHGERAVTRAARRAHSKAKARADLTKGKYR